jgi:bifunctional oligoribonuclease and PAP phosphatase NrnA
MSEAVSKLLVTGQRFVLSTHVRPDGDAIGSQLALGLFLKRLGKDVLMINSDPPPFNLLWLPGIEEIQVFDGSIDQHKRISAADAVLVMDLNALDRLGRLAAPVRNSGGKKVLVDHHTEAETWFDAAHARDTASSTGELVYELIEEIDLDLLDTHIATALYTAIMTDTGSFRFSSVTPRIHRVAAEILERGDIKPAPIHTAVFDTRSMEGLRLLGRALETITLSHKRRVGYMVLSQRMVRECNAPLEEAEGFVNYVLSVEGVEVAVLFTEIDVGVKMSFRSKGEMFVNDWARSLGGGGHRNASGAFLKGFSLEAAIDRVMSVAPKYLPLEEPHVDDEEDELSAEDASYLDSLMKAQSQRS